MRIVNIDDLDRGVLFTVDYFGDGYEYQREPSVDYSEMIRLKTNYGFGTKVFAHLDNSLILVHFDEKTPSH